MNIFQKIALTFIVVTSTNPIFAQSPIYIEISNCTDELKYIYSEPNGINYEYSNYHFTLNDYETVILQASSYNLETISRKSVIAMNRITCGESLSKQLSIEAIENIHAGKQEIYLLKSNDVGYSVIKVMEATYQVYLPNDKYLRVLSSEYGFDYNGVEIHKPGDELKTSGEGEFILFQEASMDCYDKPTFMHVPINFMRTANIEYILGIGMVRQYSELMEHRLATVNGQPIKQYLATFCNQDVVEIENIPESYSISFEEEYVEEYVETPSQKPALMIPNMEHKTIVVEEDINMSLVEEGMEEVINNSGLTSKGKNIVHKSIPVNRKVIQNKNIHIVEAGETLYGISNKYNSTVLTLKKMNQLESNIIEIGQQLKIKD